MTVRRHGHTFQSLELSFAVTPASEGSQEGAVRMEYLDPVVAGVRYADVSLIVHGYSSGELELAFVCTFAAEGGQYFAVDVEYLDPVVVGVGDHDPIRVGHRDVVWVFQLSFFVAHGAELAYKCTVRLENLKNSFGQILRYHL